MSVRIVKVAVILTLVFLSLAIVGNSMSKSVGRDEQMYCTAGVLISQGKMIYRDFSYVAQLPYHPLLLAAVYRISGTSYYLLAGRMVSVVCDVLVMVCIVGIYQRVFASYAVSGLLFGLAGVVLYVFNPLVDYANGYAWNNDVVVLLVLLSFWLLVGADLSGKSGCRRIAAIGLLLTLATFMRMTTVLAEALFLAALLLRSAGSIGHRLKTVMPFLAAAAAVSIWPVWVIAHAPRAFFVNVFRIHVLNSQWLRETGMVYDKFDLVFFSLTQPGYLVLIGLAVCLWAMAGRLGRRSKTVDIGNVVLAVLLPVTFFLIALMLPTIWRQYLAIPVPFLVVSLAYPLLCLRNLAGTSAAKMRFRIACGLVAGCVLVAAASYPAILGGVPVAVTPEVWAPVELHKVSRDIARKTGEPKLILTLAPLYALEGGCAIYTELSASPFSYRIGNLMSAAERAVTGTAGPETLDALVKKSPPSSVIVGVEMDRLEQALLKAAVVSDWERKVYEKGPVVYFRK